MSVHRKIPPYRSLDIYRLVVVRGLKQRDVTQAFVVTPARVCQVIRRVRDWVNHSIGDWLFPGRDDLRFYVALKTEQIRVQESESDPESVQFIGPGLAYTRHISTRRASEGDSGANIAASLSTQPINCNVNAPAASPAVTSCGESDFPAPAIHELAFRLAQLLMVWKKSRKVSAAFKSPPRTRA